MILQGRPCWISGASWDAMVEDGWPRRFRRCYRSNIIFVAGSLVGHRWDLRLRDIEDGECRVLNISFHLRIREAADESRCRFFLGWNMRLLTALYTGNDHPHLLAAGVSRTYRLQLTPASPVEMHGPSSPPALPTPLEHIGQGRKFLMACTWPGENVHQNDVR